MLKKTKTALLENNRFFTTDVLSFFNFRKHKGHDLAYDVKIMTSQQRLSRIATSTFL